MNPKKLLLACLEQIHGELKSRDSLAIADTAEETEKVRNLADREMEISRIDRATGNMREILSALERVDRGDYGLCIDCDDPIPERRLAALPWASRCMHCQEQADQCSASHWYLQRASVSGLHVHSAVDL